MAFLEGKKLFAGGFRADLDEKKYCYGSIYNEMELEMDCLTSRIHLKKVYYYKCQFCTNVCVSSKLVSQWWLGKI